MTINRFIQKAWDEDKLPYNRNYLLQIDGIISILFDFNRLIVMDMNDQLMRDERWVRELIAEPNEKGRRNSIEIENWVFKDGLVKFTRVETQWRRNTVTPRRRGNDWINEGQITMNYTNVISAFRSNVNFTNPSNVHHE